MSPRPDLPGILVHAIHRLHRNAVQTKLSAMGLEGVGSPMILMLLKRRGAEGGGAYQRELADALRAYAQPGDAVLFKGSRGMRMENAMKLFLGEEV